MMKAHVRDTPIALSKRVPGRPFWPSFEAVISKALAKNPDERYATAADFGEALRSCLSGRALPPSAAPSTPQASPATPPTSPSTPPASPPNPPAQLSLATASAVSGRGVRSESSSVTLPMSRVPSLVLGLIIGAGVATAGYLLLVLFK
jgi:serine/threonine-protein kinase